jgi:5-methylcytosine-specific restriction enzyme subunit McrC
MKLTVYEQSVVRVGPTTDQDRQTISSFHLNELCRFSESIDIRFLSRTYNSVRFEKFVGVVRVAGLQLEILPKLDGASTAAAVRASLVGMLGETERLQLIGTGTASLAEESGPFIRALARIYCRELLTVVRRGLPQEYVAHHEVLPYVRGKIDWADQAKLAVQQRAECSCRFDDRSIDTPLNRTLKQALIVAGSFLRDQRWFGLVSELRHSMDGVSEGLAAGWNGKLDRLNRHLQPLVNLAGLLVRGRNTDVSGKQPADEQHYALIWDMNRLFEEYISVLAARVLGAAGLQVEAQSGTHFAAECSTKRPAFPIRPDLVGFQQKTPLFVADTKWKRLESDAAVFGVSNSDAYQVAAYARRYAASRAILMYPHHPQLGRSGVLGEYLIHDNTPLEVRLSIATIDLTDLSTVGEQLRAICRAGDHEHALREVG